MRDPFGCEAISFMGHKPWDPRIGSVAEMLSQPLDIPGIVSDQHGLDLGRRSVLDLVTSGEDIRQLTYLAST